MDDMKYAVCVLEAIGGGLTLSNETDKESACIVAIKAIDTVEKIKEIVNSISDDMCDTEIAELFYKIKELVN